MNGNSRIFVAGHGGLVGSALVHNLGQAGYTNLLLRTRSELDLTDSARVAAFFADQKPEYVLLAAARVGGIMANNTYPADFIRENLEIQNSVIEASYRSGVKRLLFLGSSCIYPRDCPQPIREDYLLTGPLEPTNRPYALAKIAGIEMCWAYNRQFGTRYLAVMPCNLYGPGDNFDLNSSHVLPALIRRIHTAKLNNESEVVVWGSGKPLREFMYSDDLASACLHLMRLSDQQWDSLSSDEVAPLINVGAGEDITIADLAHLICETVGFEGKLILDPSKPDGTYRKLMDSQRMRSLGWTPLVPLRTGLRLAYEHFQSESGSLTTSAPRETRQS